jgi:hypothetical protein
MAPSKSTNPKDLLTGGLLQVNNICCLFLSSNFLRSVQKPHQWDCPSKYGKLIWELTETKELWKLLEIF